MAPTATASTDDAEKAKRDKAKAEQEEALKQINSILDQSRPKNLQQGVASGVNNIISGAIGAVGVAVLAPTIGLAVGTKNGGILGGIVGVTGGAVIGVVAAAGLAISGAVSGVTQIVRGVVAVPSSVSAPRKGKWWCEPEGHWVYTDLPKDFTALNGIPDDDSDLLGKVEAEVDKNATSAGGHVKDPYYYDILEVAPEADQSAIKRRYYILARQYHPDKVAKDDTAAHEKFKEIAEAYQVLSDPALRAKYDTDGRDGLSADKTSVAQSVSNGVDPTILFAFLFGSDRFNDYIGRLATATSALVGDSPKVTVAVARTIQKRRVTRLAVKLAEKLQKWTEGEFDLCRATWLTEAEGLSTASYGIQLVHTIGKVYTLAAVQFLGSIDAGVGLPSVSKWAKSHHAAMKRRNDAQQQKMETLKAGFAMMGVQQKLAKELSEAKTDEERKAVEAKMEAAMSDTLLKILWTTTVVDITNTLHETVQMVLFDQSVDKDTRKARAKGLQALGEVFMECPDPESSDQMEKDAKTLYEEAAFAAMLETIKRKDEASAHASGY